MECVRLRIKDIDFDRKHIHVLGKGNKWRRSNPCIMPTGKKDLAMPFPFKKKRSIDPRSRKEQRHHVMEAGLHFAAISF
ncbi:MAG: hypothetical protein JKY62_06700 [Desulfocapsa sp.]|jgi:integrase|nr:hypothetical protein [Desulfocapsa sp.]